MKIPLGRHVSRWDHVEVTSIDTNLLKTVGRVSCCWPSPAQSFLVPSPIIFILSRLWVSWNSPLKADWLTDWLTACLNNWLLGLASTVILGSESHGTHDRILLSHGSGSLETTHQRMSVGLSNCCWPSPAQSSLSSVSSRSMTKIFILSQTCACFEMGPPLRRRRGWPFYVNFSKYIYIYIYINSVRTSQETH
jgi:hypothetical protein